MVAQVGGDVLGIVTLVDSGQTDSLGEPIVTESVAWIDGCVFDIYSRGPIQQHTDTKTAEERAWAFFPYISGVTTDIVAGNVIRPQRPDALAQRDYHVFGRAEVEYDLEGQPDHVWVVCEWHGG